MNKNDGISQDKRIFWFVLVEIWNGSSSIWGPLPEGMIAEFNRSMLVAGSWKRYEKEEGIEWRLRGRVDGGRVR